MKTAVYFERFFAALTPVVLGAISCVSFTGCSNHDFDMEAELAKNIEYVYQTNFEKLVGPIAPDQSWDFSGRESNRYITRSVDINSIENLPLYNDGLNAAPLNQIHNLLQNEVTTNANYGEGFTIISTGEFVVCPIWHGACTDYRLQVSAYDAIEDITKTYEMSETDIVNRMNYSNYPSFSKAKMGNNAGTNKGLDGETGPCKGWILPFPKGTLINFKLIPLTGDGEDSKSSALIMKAEKASGMEPGGKKVYDGYIMLDDQNGDGDFNDLVLGIKYLEKAPVIVTTDVKTEEETTSTRYMIEDLGSSDASDIDFNDVVVDLSNTIKVTLTFENGVLTDRKDESHQDLVVRAMGGTMDFEFYVGTSTTPVFTKSKLVNETSMYNTLLGNINYNKDMATFKVSGWDPETNNVRIKLLNPAISSRLISTSSITAEEDGYTLSFPEPGEAPYIIAFPTTKEWRDERNSIDKSWLFGEDEEETQGE